MEWQLACYVRASRQMMDAELLTARDPRMYVQCREAVAIAGSEFYEILQPETQFFTPEGELEALSTWIGTDILWLSFREDVNLFEFHHWRSGVCVRVLVYGFGENVWERVEGEAEPWEREAFGSIPSAVRTPAVISASQAARSVANYYRLSGWAFGTPKSEQGTDTTHKQQQFP